MSIYNLDKVFQPGSVAIIGASEQEGTIGHSVVRNLLDENYQGKIYPINSKYKSIKGLPSFPSIRVIGQPIDLTVIATPIAQVHSVGVLPLKGLIS
jgi:acetyltransferase